MKMIDELYESIKAEDVELIKAFVKLAGEKLENK